MKPLPPAPRNNFNKISINTLLFYLLKDNLSCDCNAQERSKKEEKIKVCKCV